MKAAGKRRKGFEGEREVKKLFIAAGFPARRVPLSGAMKDTGFGGDVLVALFRCDARCTHTMYEYPHAERKVEVKRRAHGWTSIYKWLADNWALVYRRDRDTYLITLRLSDFLEAIRK